MLVLINSSIRCAIAHSSHVDKWYVSAAFAIHARDFRVSNKKVPFIRAICKSFRSKRICITAQHINVNTYSILFSSRFFESGPCACRCINVSGYKKQFIVLAANENDRQMKSRYLQAHKCTARTHGIHWHTYARVQETPLIFHRASIHKITTIKFNELQAVYVKVQSNICIAFNRCSHEQCDAQQCVLHKYEHIGALRRLIVQPRNRW